MARLPATNAASSNRILVVDDDVRVVGEYMHCLSRDFEPDTSITTLGDLEKVLFGQETDERGSARFEVSSCTQGSVAVQAVEEAVRAGNPFAIVFLDIRMPPGIDGVEAARRIREIDQNVNIVLVTGSMSPQPDNLGEVIPPADRVFFFKKPFHAVECRQLAAALCGKWNADLALRRANEVLEQRVVERTAELRRLAYFDPVTGLPNRLKLVASLQHMLDTSNRGARDAVILLDVERFSFLNETMGYDAGTAMLRAIGGRLERVLEAPAGEPPAVVGRFGSDEFACLLPAIADHSEMEAKLQTIREAIEEPFVIRGRDVWIKASIGVAWHPAHGDDADRVFRCAESALHRAMRKLNSTVVYYRDEMEQHARYKFDLEAEIRQALSNDEVNPYVQPQVCLKTGRLAGAEALARWIRPDGTVVSPSDFVPLTEEMGFSDLLFECILKKVCALVAEWRDREGWAVPVSVNLSAHQFRHRDLAGLVKSIIRDAGVSPKLIKLELTETALLEDLAAVRPILTDLSGFGVGIHVDDFGTGYSSLSYLAELPVQTLKIDRSFVDRLTDSPTNGRVVQAIVALGKAMNLGLVAEGVETEQQLALLRQLGCDLAQGYLFGEPMLAEDLVAWQRTLARRMLQFPAA